MNSKITILCAFLFSIFIGCSDGDSGVDDPEQNLTDQEIEAICKKTWENVTNIIGDKYLNAEKPSELAYLIDDIKKLEYVETAGYDNQSLYVVLKNGSVWNCLFNNLKSEPYEGISEAIETVGNDYSIYASRASSTPHIIKKIENEKIKVLIFNQTFRDESRQDEKRTWLSLKEYLEYNGFEVTYKEADYDMSDIHDYHLAILHTHGVYRLVDGYNFHLNEHYLLTSQMVQDSYMGDYIVVKEVRNGKKCEVNYKAVSETKFKELYSGQKLNERETFIFATSCEALMSNSGLADAFNSCGASGFVGYTDMSSVGMAAANSFFRSLSMDKTIQEAFDEIPQRYKHQTKYTDDETGELKNINAILKVEYNSQISRNYCYTHICPDDKHPHLIDMGSGTKWSCCNIGASSPYSIGDYYSWGGDYHQD